MQLAMEERIVQERIELEDYFPLLPPCSFLQAELLLERRIANQMNVRTVIIRRVELNRKERSAVDTHRT
jgi:hypothetical protein